jgi:hypothetical protein
VEAADPLVPGIARMNTFFVASHIFIVFGPSRKNRAQLPLATPIDFEKPGAEMKIEGWVGFHSRLSLPGRRGAPNTHAMDRGGFQIEGAKSWFMLD